MSARPGHRRSPSRLVAAVAAAVVCSGLLTLPHPAAADVGAPEIATTVPSSLGADRWITHYREDVLPYWEMPEGLGEPVGNFPTNRGRDGEVAGSSTRMARMLARQVYTYSTGYLLTGEERLLDHARAGVDWLLQHSKDRAHGGYFGSLNADGTPVDPGAPKGAADLSYIGLGLASYWNVTRDPAIEREVLAIRDLLFDPAVYWDEGAQRIRDAVSYDLSTAVDPGDDGGDLVALLDPGNALLLYIQPILSDPARRAQVRDDLRRLAESVVAQHRHVDGVMFAGTTGNTSGYGPTKKHTDYGHTLKTYWFLHNVDRLFDDRPFVGLAASRHQAIERAYDRDHQRWAHQPTGPASNAWGSAWWMHNEANQLLATLNVTTDEDHTDRLAGTAASFIDIYVDEGSPAREMPFRIARGYTWRDPEVWSRSTPTVPGMNPVKAGPNKNGFHATEHAIVMYLHGRELEGVPATLHFAVPAPRALHFDAAPYLFHGNEVRRKVVGDVRHGRPTLVHVEISFSDLH